MIRAGVTSAGRGHRYEKDLSLVCLGPDNYNLQFYLCVYLSWNTMHGIPVIENWGSGVGSNVLNISLLISFPSEISTE